MKKVLVAYYSSAGTTEKMAGYIAEGVRFSGQEAVTKNIDDIRMARDLEGYDGYIFGAPTYSLDVPGPMKAFIQMAKKAGLEGKAGGAFGPYTHLVGYRHDSHAAAVIFGSLQSELKMRPFELGPFNLQEDVLNTSDGMRTCQDYGRVFGEKLGAQV